MLGFSLKPLPEELVYSMAIRLYVITGSGTISSLLGRMFIESMPLYGLPRNLPSFATVMPDASISIEHLVRYHTHLPYYQRFAPLQDFQAMRTRMEDGFSLPGARGILSQVHRVGMPLACPGCVADDVGSEVGQAAWRRVHLLPGVSMCPVHGVRLRVTQGSRWMVGAPDAPDRCGPPVDGLADEETAMSIARGSQWLLDHPGPPPGPEALRSGLLRLLSATGWLEGDAIRVGFRREMAGRLCLNELRTSRSDLGEERKSSQHWLRQVWSPDKVVPSHPLRYLLILAFLRRDMSELFIEAGKPDAGLVVAVDEGHRLLPGSNA